ncbi:hypothetical protein CGRA01v4_00106 [Colletotrichum graminicola]|nr:hypothetical protein CGRA01v4_00106 [Colletotrichum graminicola]
MRGFWCVSMGRETNKAELSKREKGASTRVWSESGGVDIRRLGSSRWSETRGKHQSSWPLGRLAEAARFIGTRTIGRTKASATRLRCRDRKTSGEMRREESIPHIHTKGRRPTRGGIGGRDSAVAEDCSGATLSLRVIG